MRSTYMCLCASACFCSIPSLLILSSHKSVLWFIWRHIFPTSFGVVKNDPVCATATTAIMCFARCPLLPLLTFCTVCYCDNLGHFYCNFAIFLPLPSAHFLKFPATRKFSLFSTKYRGKHVVSLVRPVYTYVYCWYRYPASWPTYLNGNPAVGRAPPSGHITNTYIVPHTTFLLSLFISHTGSISICCCRCSCFCC